MGLWPIGRTHHNKKATTPHPSDLIRPQSILLHLTPPPAKKQTTGINVTDVPEGGYGAWDAFASKEGMAGLLAAHKEAMVRALDIVEVGGGCVCVCGRPGLGPVGG